YLSHSGVIQLFLQRKALVELCGQNLRESKLPVNLVEPEVTLKFSGLFSKHAGDLSLALLNIKSGVCVIFSTQTLLPVSTIIEVKSMKVGDFSNLGYRQLKIQLRSGQPHELNENSSAKAQPQVSSVLRSELELIRDNVRRAKVQILDMDRELAKLSWKLGSENPKGDPDLVRNIIGRCEDANESAREDRTDWTITFSDPVLFQDWVLLPMCVDGMAMEQKVSVHVISPRNRSFQVLKEGNKSGQWTIAIQATLIVGYSGQMQGCLHWKVDSGFRQQLFEIPRLKIPPIEMTKTALRVALPFLNCIQLGLVNRAGSDLKDTLQALGLDEISNDLFAESSNRYHGPAFVKLAQPRPQSRMSLPSEACFFGEKCFRKNPHHFREYSHPHLVALIAQFGTTDPPQTKSIEVAHKVILIQLKMLRELFPSLVKAKRDSPPVKRSKLDPESSQVAANSTEKKSLILRKLESAAPFYFFLTKVKDSPQTHRDLRSVYITELLHPSLGTIKKSLQINFMIEWAWLQMNYEETGNQASDKPLLLIYGDDNPELMPVGNLPSNVRAQRVKPRYPFGTHHTKMMLFHYDDGSVRVVVSTANLIGSDWTNRTQGLWISPRCPTLPSSSASSNLAELGESRTRFKASLLRYLKYYELSALREYIEAVKQCDFSAVNVFLIASVPNSHRGPDLNLWGQKALANRLKQNIKTDIGHWPLIMQCSSIGSLGPAPESWLRGELAQSMCTTGQISSGTSPNVKLIYPSRQNVMDSYDGILGGGCLPYSQKTHLKQPWLRDYLHEWRCDIRHRSRAMPHIKCYTRINPEGDKAAYFLLTSANLSKAAWGSFNKAKDGLMIMSYEAGVLFLPQFVTGQAWFNLENQFNLPYDWPLKKYEAGVKPWFMDYLRTALAD
ncbi:hypothetical protein TCAL_04219, partial [Tigriopus californicus]